MASIRQEKINGIIQEELSKIFQQESRSICLGAMVTVTTVRVSPDLSTAKIYVSIFGGKDNEATFESIKENGKQVRHRLSQITRHQLRRVPELTFYVDDSLDYANKIDELLK